MLNAILLSSRTGAASKSLKTRTTALNEVAATYSSNGPASKFKSNAPSTTSTKLVDNEPEIAPAVGGLRDEDDTKEREAALSSPIKGKDSQNSTAVSISYCFQSFFC